MILLFYWVKSKIMQTNAVLKGRGKKKIQGVASKGKTPNSNLKVNSDRTMHKIL